MGTELTATHLARSIIRSLIENGVKSFVLSPGSRNAPLSIALYEAKERGLIDLYVKIDERGAAYFALGISKATDNYVAVICTSGTAAANYHPAILEAHHAHNKLLVITADRPERLRATGANQTTNQSNLFGDIHTFDIAGPFDVTPLLRGGPVHLNAQFDEPLLPSDAKDWLSELIIKPREKASAEHIELALSGKTVFVIGHDCGTFSAAEINEKLASLRAPIIAEDPLSFPQALNHASIFLADEEVRGALKAEHVIVIGRTTLSRSVNAFIAGAEELTVIDPRSTSVDHLRSADNKFTVLPNFTGSVDAAYFDKWKEAAQIAHLHIHDFSEFSEANALAAISENLPRGAALFVGSSRPIRDIEGFAAPRSGIKIFANRGLAGIDGNISTALGIAQAITPTLAVLGDLTFLHDLSALIDIGKSPITIFIIDNNGGGIFSTLPQAGVTGFEEIFGTPHNLNMESVVQGFGIETRRVGSIAEIKEVLSTDSNKSRVVIVDVPSRSHMAHTLKSIYQRVSSAVRMGFNLA